jgi:radical SAM superfamily enzyme YgiQ (UPF0313 family)
MKLPRLGAVLLGTIARAHGWDVRVYVEDIAEIDYRDALTADLVGISTITSTAMRAYTMADALRERGVPVVMGGPHVTFLADEALQHCDYVVRGEGEEALPLLLTALRTNGDLGTVPNLSYRLADGTACHNPQTSSVDDLDALPYPDFNLIVGWHHAKSFTARPIYPVLTSRGCPFGCTFCSVIGMFGRRMRFRSVAHVIGEMEQNGLHDKYVFFYDDNFAADKARTKRLLREAIEKRGLAGQWSAQVRVDAAKDGDLFALMKRTRCNNVYIGFESVDPQALAEMNKRQTAEDLTQAVATFTRYGIDVHGMFVFGFDADTTDSLQRTIEFARRSGMFSAQFILLTPLPGTPLFETLREQGRLTIKDWSYFDGHHVVFRPAKLASWELQWAQIKGHALFYSRWRAFHHLLRGSLAGMVVCHYARRLNHEWQRFNRTYLDALKLAARRSPLKVSFDLSLDFSDIREQVRRAAAALLPAPAMG